MDSAAATPTTAEPEIASERLRVLVIDDEPAIRRSLAATLVSFACHVDTAGDVDGALAHLRASRYDLAFCDLRLGAADGIELMPKLIAASPDLQIVVITAFASIETAVRAVKAGAVDYLPKPFAARQVRELIDNALRERRFAQEMSDFERTMGAVSPEIDLQSHVPAMQTVYQQLTRAAGTDAPVLLRGSSGTGKATLAHALHLRSRRREGPFVTMNCATLGAEFLASELFGHVKGAFAGATRDHQGKVAEAHGGTLLLADPADLPLGVQAKLLKLLHDQSYDRLGESQSRRADVRLVVATTQDLAEQVRAGRFRDDLLYRLNVFEVLVPPLRERREDIIDLAQRFLAQFARATGRPPLELSPAAQDVLLRHSWPGNISELRNQMQRAAVLWPARVIEPEAFASHLAQPEQDGPQLGGTCTLADVEGEHIRRVLLRANTFEEAAIILAIEPSTLWRKRKRLGL